MGSGKSGRGCQFLMASNAYKSDNRLIVGNAENGGLADVNNNWHDNVNNNIGFRVLAVLHRFFPATNHFSDFNNLKLSSNVLFLIEYL